MLGFVFTFYEFAYRSRKFTFSAMLILIEASRKSYSVLHKELLQIKAACYYNVYVLLLLLHLFGHHHAGHTYMTTAIACIFEWTLMQLLQL